MHNVPEVSEESILAIRDANIKIVRHLRHFLASELIYLPHWVAGFLREVP